MAWDEKVCAKCGNTASFREYDVIRSRVDRPGQGTEVVERLGSYCRTCRRNIQAARRAKAKVERETLGNRCSACGVHRDRLAARAPYVYCRKCLVYADIAIDDLLDDLLLVDEHVRQVEDFLTNYWMGYGPTDGLNAYRRDPDHRDVAKGFCYPKHDVCTDKFIRLQAMVALRQDEIPPPQ